MNIDTLAKKQQALALVKENRLKEARDLYTEICSIDSMDAEAWFRLGTTYLTLNALSQAEDCFRRTIELGRRIDIAYYNLGRCFELQGKKDDAIAVYRKLLEIAPNIEAYFNIGVIYQEQGKFAEALETFRQAQRIQPDNTKLILAEAGIYIQQGDYERAYELIRPYLETGRESPNIVRVFAILSRHLKCEAQAINLMERLLARGELAGNIDEQIATHFALGKLLDAVGDYDRAFHHFQQGNSLYGNTFNPSAYSRVVDAVIQTFNADFMRQAPRAAVNDEHLIFILGMPRSGTTLVEQILDSHPQVYGCEELPDIMNMANSLPEFLGVKEGYPQAVGSLTVKNCTMLAQRYLKRVRELSGDADFVTDKMTLNFLHLGLIALLFPRAKVIHCVRDPLDTCVSCYFQHFRYQRTGLGFSTDLANLGNYYRQYQRLMQHWKTTLDIAILDVSYEMLVADPEKVTRQIVEFCGLPWDERCLKFYESDRTVITASYDQVRQPIYQKSVQRWKNYEAHLEPLKKALIG